MRHVMVVCGTRPEAIKMAPVIHALRDRKSMRCTVVATAQHRQMLDQVLNVFGIRPDFDLDIMTPGQSLNELCARLLIKMQEVILACRPDVMLVQGDTTSVLAASLAAFHERVPVGHVEAGLRTGNLDSPFPEEMNRVVTSRVAKWHFAPTQQGRQNLLREGIPDNSISVTGNTVIDALLSVLDRDLSFGAKVPPEAQVILVTAHRRENFGEPLQRICRALNRILEALPDVHVVFPVHPNPNVLPIARAALGAHPRVHLLQPLEYLSFVGAMKRADLILTDSGGVQEEAPALAKPVLVMRSETERPEAVDAGAVKLVGTDEDAIFRESIRLLTDLAAYRAMAKGISPYGDGKAASRIVDILERS